MGLDDRELLQVIVDWARTYLARPHPRLGRPGPVCPFVGPALDRDVARLAVIRGVPPDDVVDQILTDYLEVFLRTTLEEHRSRHLQFLLVLFPDVGVKDAPAVIDGAQQRLKPRFVAQGAMIGQFHPGPPPEPGLWSPDFRPFAAPVPLLAVRQMHPNDLLFLRDRPEFAQAYLRRFGDRVPQHLRPQVAEVMERFHVAADGRRAPAVTRRQEPRESSA